MRFSPAASWNANSHAGILVCWFAHHVAHAAHRVQEPLLISNFKLLAQIAHVDFDDVALTAKVVAPHAVKDHIASEHLARVAHEELKQLVFLGCKGDNALAAHGLASASVEREV